MKFSLNSDKNNRDFLINVAKETTGVLQAPQSPQQQL
jgi:hypothetical protein